MPCKVPFRDTQNCHEEHRRLRVPATPEITVLSRTKPTEPMADGWTWSKAGPSYCRQSGIWRKAQNDDEVRLETSGAIAE